MSCERINREYIEAMNAYVAAEEALNKHSSQFVGSPPVTKAVVVPSDDWDTWQRLEDDAREKTERYFQSMRAYARARQYHKK